MLKVAYLGPEGTVSEESARYFFQGKDVAFIPYKIIGDVFAATSKGETDLSVIPIENTIDGSVSLHLDMLVHDNELPIAAEWVYPSIQNLIGIAQDGEWDMQRIKRVISHPVAVGQCRAFIKEHLPHAEIETVSSTAEGVRMVQEYGQPDIAAIATQLAARKYGLSILQPTIQDHHNNFTRFLLVGSKPPKRDSQGKVKTTIMITLPEDYPGALHQVLSAFAWRRINLSRIESRPTKKKLGSYFFFIDIEETLDSVLLPAAIQEIEAIGCQVRIFGSYMSYRYEREQSEV
ncbi:prephenate dehydratase [Marinicrinis sediminis]|uniref:Prephenate dehydratase n=1 Tax=Marinicrinis sediminis TaxID=1652465 RepID=A0ABW5R8M6_9BACL